MKNKIFASLLLVLFSLNAMAADDVSDKIRKQVEICSNNKPAQTIKKCIGDGLSQATNLMNRMYNDVVQDSHVEPKLKDLWIKSQNSWLVFAGEECKLEMELFTNANRETTPELACRLDVTLTRIKQIGANLY